LPHAALQIFGFRLGQFSRSRDGLDRKNLIVNSVNSMSTSWQVAVITDWKMGSRSDPMILVAEPHHANLRHRLAQQKLQAVRSLATGASGTDSMSNTFSDGFKCCKRSLKPNNNIKWCKLSILLFCKNSYDL
jgi:hypothetical protein